jgi:hypothetical protein
MLRTRSSTERRNCSRISVRWTCLVNGEDEDVAAWPRGWVGAPTESST